MSLQDSSRYVATHMPPSLQLGCLLLHVFRLQGPHLRLCCLCVPFVSCPQGTKGMKVGGTRTVVIPAHLGYGARGAPPDIPGNATLVFDLELVSVK